MLEGREDRDRGIMSVVSLGGQLWWGELSGGGGQLPG